MTEDRAGFPVRRVTIALDAAERDLGWLGAEAVGLAVRLRADLDALLLEDPNLGRLAALPEARYVGRFGGPTAAAAADIEAEFRALATLVRATIEREAARRGISWSLRVERETPDRGLRRVAAPGDLLVVSVAASLWRTLTRHGRTLSQLAGDLPCSTLVVTHRRSRRRPLLVVGRESGLAEPILAAAASLAPADDGDIDVVHGPGLAVELRERARVLLAGRGYRCRFRMVAQADDPDAVVRIAAEIGADLVILPTDALTLGDMPLEALTERISSSLLIVR